MDDAHQAVLLELEARKRATQEFLTFIVYTKRDFVINWHHQVLAEKLQEFAEGRIKKMMVFLQPQVGKSEMSTRRLPSYILGRNPDKRIAICAYNQTFASKFNRDIQRIIDDQPYKNVFPFTVLNGKNVVSNAHGNYLRNSEEFELVGRRGSLKSVGVGGGLTGNPVDIGIIDDPIKGAEEANSHTYRDKIWDWYEMDFLTRLHNDSQQLITLTRWHEDDLAGRIMKKESDWEILIFPAIREDKLNKLDPREIGEVLWPQRHNLERMRQVEKSNPPVWSSLYQQRPHFSVEDKRFAWAFSEEKHVGRCQWNPRENTYLSFDFNHDPISCTVFQHNKDRRLIHVLRCIKLEESNIKALLKEIQRLYPYAVFVVTGDATGKNTNAMVEDKLNYYKIIEQTLNLNRAAMKQPLGNPRIEFNRVLLNVLLQNYNWVIDEKEAAGVIFDMKWVKVLPDGSIDKTDRKDPTKQADALDTVRYYCNTFFKDYLKAADSLVDTAERAAVPPIEIAKKQAIEAISAGRPVVCSAEHYMQGIRAAIVTQAHIWLEEKNLAFSSLAITEVNRLDKLFQLLKQ